jgi:hypothetical protein
VVNDEIIAGISQSPYAAMEAIKATLTKET